MVYCGSKRPATDSGTDLLAFQVRLKALHEHAVLTEPAS